MMKPREESNQRRSFLVALLGAGAASSVDMMRPQEESNQRRSFLVVLLAAGAASLAALLHRPGGKEYGALLHRPGGKEYRHRPKEVPLREADFYGPNDLLG